MTLTNLLLGLIVILLVMILAHLWSLVRANERAAEIYDKSSNRLIVLLIAVVAALSWMALAD